MLLLGGPAQAANLLVNPGFESDSGHVIPVGWTRFAPPTAQVYGNYATEGIITNHSGSIHFKEWGPRTTARTTSRAFTRI